MVKYQMTKPDLRDCLQHIKPYKPGKPVEEVERELGLSGVIKLASNENPLGASPLAIEAMQKNLNKMHDYPDGYCYYLREALSQKLGVRPDQLIFGNGSDEILSFLALAYVNPGDEALMATPSFSQYEFAMRLVGGVPRQVELVGDNFEYDLDAILAAVNDKTRLVFLCTPNNPTGTIIRKQELKRFLEKLPDKVLLVLDQAYIEYAKDPDHPTGIEYIENGYPVISLRTFSKIYGLAGLRIGYGVAPAEVVADLSRVREPFSVNAMAQAAARAALEDRKHVERSRQMVENSRRQLTDGFTEMGLKVVPDQANFCFVDTGVDSKEVFQALMQRGVIVRTGDIFGYPTYIRVTYGTEEQNKRFLEGLKEVLAELS